MTPTPLSADSSPTEAQHAPSELQPGDLLMERYQLSYRLGEGGYSQVFAADDLLEHREVAIKVLRHDIVQRDPSALARLRQESKLLERIEHPHIVKIFAFEQTDEASFLVMEKLLGRSIAYSLRHEGPASSERVVLVVRQILGALGAAHDQHILHRDIKPENIILCPSSDPAQPDCAKLVDFGLAKAFSVEDAQERGLFEDITLVHTRTQGFMGTPRYTPPEQALGDKLGPYTDLFALGLVIAEWLTGQVRLRGTRHAELMALLISGEPLDLADCPSAWRPWLARVLDKNPTKRYQSAQEALDALDRLMSERHHHSHGRELEFNAQTGSFVPVSLAAHAPPHATLAAAQPSYASPQDRLEDHLVEDEPLELELELDLPPRRPMPPLSTPPPLQASPPAHPALTRPTQAVSRPDDARVLAPTPDQSQEHNPWLRLLLSVVLTIFILTFLLLLLMQLGQ